MLRSLLLIALALSAPAVRAAQRVTVEQLQRCLAQQQAAQESDADAALQLGSLELNERLTAATLARLKSEFHPGKKTGEELELLADLSAFLNPPAAELLPKAAPDAAAQQEMMREATEFATNTLAHLPDFLATRTTFNYEDVPVLTDDSSFQSGLHPVGSSVREVAYRKGLEFSAGAPSARAAGAPAATAPSLSSAGEFGPILATVMTDSARGNATWSYWEQTPEGPAAVYRYEVPQAAAHYKIDFCCSRNPVTRMMDSYHGTPAYRGSITVNPSTGAVLRLTLEADLKTLVPPEHFALVVQYGEVEISGDSLICPLESAAIFRAVIEARRRTWDVIHINHASFTNYRRFGSTAKIVPDATAR
jgi:hypothetical protein